MVLSKADFLALPDSTVLLWPQYGDTIVPINPRIAIFQGNFECTDTLIGTTRDDGSYTKQTSKKFEEAELQALLDEDDGQTQEHLAE
ncbi:hypothetical protein TNCV_1004531 [Trichonephila clavipes]|nr:hypothetical protein TNCV_1004531 [Trichonephila clavipes]